MKILAHLFLLALILLFFSSCQKESPLNSTVQNEPADSLKNITKLQQFLTKRGILIVKDFYHLGKIQGLHSAEMDFDAVVLYEPGKESERVRGIRIQISVQRSYGVNNETAFLDMEELESLSKALDYMNNLKITWANTPKEYTEVAFETHGNFKTGFYKQKNDVMAWTSAGYGEGNNCFLKQTEELLSIKKIIDNGIALLDKK
jgi:hypothetical protein